MLNRTRKFHFPFFMSIFMSGIMSFVLGIFHNGFNLDTLANWPVSWFIATVFAFPTVIFLNPIVSAICKKLNK